MPINLTIDSDVRLVIMDVIGQTTLDDWRESIRESLKSSGNDSSWNVLVDVSKHETVAPSQFVWELASKFTSSGNISAKWAIVVSRVVSEGISNMISTLVRDSGIEVRAFKDREEALKWVVTP